VTPIYLQITQYYADTSSMTRALKTFLCPSGCGKMSGTSGGKAEDNLSETAYET